MTVLVRLFILDQVLCAVVCLIPKAQGQTLGKLTYGGAVEATDSSEHEFRFL